MEQQLIDNIDTTYNGTKYAYEKEQAFDTEFVAECIEHGEQFTTSFFAPKAYNRAQLYDIGRELAMGWGGECISVSRVVSHNKDNDTMQVMRV